MRWIFLTLLLLNLLVLVQQRLGQANHYREDWAQDLVPEHTPRLLLLDEKLAARANASRLVGALGEGKGAEGVWHGDSNDICHGIGPYGGVQEAQRSLDLLAQAGWSARMLPREVKRDPDYWVYLEPFANREQAIQMLRELQQVYKVDSFLISQGPLENGISLGLFKSREAARALQQQRIGQGLEARLAEIERAAVEYWLVFEREFAEDMRREVLSLLERQGIHQEGRMISCKGIASELVLP